MIKETIENRYNNVSWLDGNDYYRFLCCTEDLVYSVEKGFTLEFNNSIEAYEELVDCEEVELKEVTVKKWVGV